MLIKFETRSHRVKSVAFHPTRPWVLAALHSGVVQLWDYCVGSLVERFEEHVGPVRGVDFHSVQPLFCSGGDDYKVRVWNYKMRRCLFTLSGHLDFVRTVQFHSEQPWIVSASDDQCVRIWNWQSRSCVSVLTGHNHYVMSAKFHPTEDYVVSASLDETLRVWDISALKTRRPSGNDYMGLNQELFGNDVMVKFILEGHEKGVNTAAFHPTLPYIVSGADDRSIRIWKMDEARVFEIEQLRGHSDNVSCCMYFGEHILSDSEDHTLRVWDLKQRTPIVTHRRDNERFWCLAVHPTKELVAAGHDGGLMVFKLERERPAYCFPPGTDSVYWQADRRIKCHDFKTNETTTVMTLPRTNPNPVALSFSPSEQSCVLCYDADGGSYDLVKCKQGLDPLKRGYYSSAVFFSRNKFAVMDKFGQIIIRDAANEIVKIIPAPLRATHLKAAGPGQILCRSDEKIVLFDVSQRAVLGEVSAAKVKHVVWDVPMTKCAFLSERVIMITNRRLTSVLVFVHETVRVKSGAFDTESPLFIYSTSNHLKFCMPNGDTATICTLPAPIYIVRVAGNKVHYLNRQGNLATMTYDDTEPKFKLALLQERYLDCVKLLRTVNYTPGTALVSYLQDKVYPEVAMLFVKEPLLKFKLALQCGMLDVAKETLSSLPTAPEAVCEAMNLLSTRALAVGELGLASTAYQRTNEFSKLTFLHLCTGQLELVADDVAENSTKTDVSTKLTYSLMLGDSESSTKYLLDAGQFSMAYIHALSNPTVNEEGETSTEVLDNIKSTWIESVVADKEIEEAEATAEVEGYIAKLESRPVHPKVPAPTPQCIPDSWPLLPLKPTIFTRFLQQQQAPGQFDEQPDEDAGVCGWGGDSDLDDDASAKEGSDISAGDGDSDGAWGDGLDDLDLPSEDKQSKAAAAAGSGFVMPPPGRSPARVWADFSPIPADHIAAGSFETAIPMLQRQIGLVDTEPIKHLLIRSALSSFALLSTFPQLPPRFVALERKPEAAAQEKAGYKRATPSLPYTQSHTIVTAGLQNIYKLFREGKFSDASAACIELLHTALTVSVPTLADAQAMKKAMSIATEYLCALRVQLEIKNSSGTDGDSVVRQLALSAYFCHFDLQPSHLMRVVKQAMVTAYKAKAFKLAGTFARRLLDMSPDAETAAKARQVAHKAEGEEADSQKIDYNDRNPFVLCMKALKPLYHGTTVLRCSFCYAAYGAEFSKQKCVICNIAQIDSPATGLVSCFEQS